MKRIAILFTCMALVISACNKQELINKDDLSNDDINVLKRSENEHDPPTIEPEQLVDNPNEPITEGILEENGILKFECMETFEVVMESLINQPFDKLDDWESALGFTSIRSINEALLDDADNMIDDDVFDDGRIQDPAFETVLNEENKIIIGDKGYTFDYSDMENRLVTIWGSNDQGDILEIKYLDNVDQGSRSECYPALASGNFKTTVTKSFSSKRKVVGKKGCEAWLFYASVYMSTSYKEKKFGLWSKKETDIAAQLDQWHSLVYTAASGVGAIVTISNVEKISKAKKLTHIFASMTNRGAYAICEFGRIHHWKVSEGYNNDAHNEPW